MQPQNFVPYMYLLGISYGKNVLAKTVWWLQYPCAIWLHSGIAKRHQNNVTEGIEVYPDMHKRQCPAGDRKRDLFDSQAVVFACISLLHTFSSRKTYVWRISCGWREDGWACTTSTWGGTSTPSSGTSSPAATSGSDGSGKRVNFPMNPHFILIVAQNSHD